MVTRRIPVRIDIGNVINAVIGFINKVNEIEDVEDIEDIEVLRDKIIDLQQDRPISVFDVQAKILISRIETIANRAIEINDEIILGQLELIGAVTKDETEDE